LSSLPGVLLGLMLGGVVLAARAASVAPMSTPRARLPRPVVLTQLPIAGVEQKQVVPSAGMLRAPYGDGARLARVEPDLSTRVLTEGFHSACDPDVSFDGRRLLFAGRKSAGDRWAIYEMAADGSNARQITREAGNCRSPAYQSSLYSLAVAEPWHQITFVGDAAGAPNECGAGVATHLYSCRLDGTDVRRLTFNLSSDLDPWLMPDGRLLFASWQRRTLDRGPRGRVGLFGVNLDGTDFAAFAADEGRRIQHMPCTTPAGLAVFVEADEATWDGAGSLSCVSLRRPLHSCRAITRGADGLFHSPSPLPDGAMLVSRRRRDGSGTHGLYRLDPATGECELVFDDPGCHDIQARLVHPRPEPDGRSSVVTDDDPHGKLYCLNVYTTDLRDRRWLPLGTVRRVRVLEGVPTRARAGARGQPPLALRRMLGEAEVKPDGSFNIEVPANTPIELQTLDADGMALRSCGWIWARNHEPRGCIGCHEDPELTPENSFNQSLEGASELLCPPVEKRRVVDFGRDLMPIVEAKCLPCHGQGGAKPRLDARPLASSRYPSALLEHVHPGSARTSPLAWHLFGRNTARPWDGAAARRSARPIRPGKAEPLTEFERRAFVEWIDLGARWTSPEGNE